MIHSKSEPRKNHPSVIRGISLCNRDPLHIGGGGAGEVNTLRFPDMTSTDN